MEDPNMRTGMYFFGRRDVSTSLVPVTRGEEVRTMLASLRNVCTGSRCCLTAETVQGSGLYSMLGRAEGGLNFPRAASLSGDRLFCFLGRRCGWGSSVAEQPTTRSANRWPNRPCMSPTSHGPALQFVDLVGWFQFPTRRHADVVSGYQIIFPSTPAGRPLKWIVGI